MRDHVRHDGPAAGRLPLLSLLTQAPPAADGEEEERGRCWLAVVCAGAGARTLPRRPPAPAPCAGTTFPCPAGGCPLLHVSMLACHAGRETQRPGQAATVRPLTSGPAHKGGRGGAQVSTTRAGTAAPRFQVRVAGKDSGADLLPVFQSESVVW